MAFDPLKRCLRTYSVPTFNLIDDVLHQVFVLYCFSGGGPPAVAAPRLKPIRYTFDAIHAVGYDLNVVIFRGQIDSTLDGSKLAPLIGLARSR